MVRRISNDQQEALRAAFRAGLSIRASARYANVDKNTAVTHFHMQPPMLCPCGSPLPHKHWCAHRVALSPGRQAFLERIAAGNIKEATRVRWSRVRSEILAALESSQFLISVDADAMKELRRFYNAVPRLAPQWDDDEEAMRLVAVAEADQEQASFALFAALERLHPAVRRFVLNIVDGSSLDEAANECGISTEGLAVVMPRLKVFLRPYL